MSAVATPDLSKPPGRTRSGFAVGLAASADSPVDRKGGIFKQGLIRGVSVCTRAEALGHGVWIDSEFLQSTADYLNEADKGIKARFTHPSLCADGLGNYLGRFRDAYVDGDQVRADLHMTEAGHKAKDGDMADYVMGLAEEDPEAFATSIVFTHDPNAAAVFVVENGGTGIDDWGQPLGDFQSPDPLNTDNLPHARMAKLHACDVVDEPAANPGGFFSNGDNFTAEIDLFFAYSLGLTDDRPRTNSLGIDCDRARGFASRFMSARGLTLTPKEDAAMSDTNETEAPAVEETPEVVDSTETEEAADTPETPEIESVQDEASEPEAEQPAEPEVVAEAEEPQPIAASAESDGQKFLDAFGDKGGVWFAQGKTFGEATELHIKEQAERIADLESRLAASDRGMDEPVEFDTVVVDEPADPAFEKQVAMWMRDGKTSREEAEKKAEQVLARRKK